MFIEDVSVFEQVHLTIRDVKIKDTEGKTFVYNISYHYSQEILKKQKIKAVGATSDQHQIKMLTAGRIQYGLINTTTGILTINKDLEFKIKIVGHLSGDAFYQAFSDNI